MKRSRLLLAIILVAVSALVGSLWIGEGPLWRWVTVKTIPFESEGLVVPEETVRGWRKVNRWNAEEILQVSYYVRNGFKERVWEFKNGGSYRITFWRPDGTVDQQARFGDQLDLSSVDEFLVEERGSELVDVPAERSFNPPWWWGVTNQTEPTAPCPSRSFHPNETAP